MNLNIIDASNVGTEIVNDVTIAYENPKKIQFEKGLVRGFHVTEDQDSFFMIGENVLEMSQALKLSRDILAVAKALTEYQTMDRDMVTQH